MNGAKKIKQMMEFEINNCKKNISFYKDQMNKNYKNKKFYEEQIVLMQRKLETLQSSVSTSVNLDFLSEKLQGFF